MNIGEYQCDIVDVLQNQDFNILKKVSSFCYKFKKHVVSKLESATTCGSEHTNMKAESINKMLELQQEVQTLQFAIDEVMLQQKILDRKMINMIKQEEKLKNEVIEAKACRDALALELVDLRQEVQERREAKLKKWDAIKRATTIYKSNLDFGIYVERKEDFEVVKVSFFRKSQSVRDKYCVRLINEEKLWKVKEIHPVLKKEHWIYLKGTVDFTTHSEISNITAFLCLLRIIFLKYYMDSS